MSNVTPITIATRRPKRGILEIRAELDYFMEEASANNWSDKIPCHRDPRAFTEDAPAAHQEEAQAACYRCPVLELCNEYAWATRAQRKHGNMIYGGVAWQGRSPAFAETEEALNIAHPKIPKGAKKAA